MPKGQMIMPTTPREYTLERLQELRHQADLAGDTATRDALSDKIHKIGGKVPSRGIPDNETKIGRFERLRQDALDVNDLETAGVLAVRIAEQEVGIPTDFVAEDEVLQAQQLLLEAIKTNKFPEIVADLMYQYKQAIKHDIWGEYDGSDTDKAIDTNPADPRTPPEVMADDVMRVVRDVCRPQDAPEALTTAPESDLNALEGPEATVSVNDGTASVNATAKIKRMGFQLEDIPAKDGGKVTVYDVNAYANMLAEV